MYKWFKAYDTWISLDDLPESTRNCMATLTIRVILTDVPAKINTALYGCNQFKLDYDLICDRTYIIWSNWSWWSLILATKHEAEELPREETVHRRCL